MAIPGLPALAAGIVIEVVQLATADALSGLGSSGDPQWGLFLDGSPAVVADNVVSFEFKQDFRNSSFPVEEGSFETYNKVPVPYDVRLRFSTGGSVTDRQTLTQSIDAIIGSTQLFDGVTPEKVYQSINPVHQSIRRTAHSGVGLLVVDVYCEEVRVTATQQFTSSQQAGSPSSVAPAAGGTGGSTTTPINQPQSPSAAPQVSDGTVQPVAPTAAQAAIFSNAMPLP